MPSPPCSSWPLLSVPSGTPIRLLSPVHTLPFLPGPVPGPLPGGLAPSRRLGLSPYKPTLGPEWSLGVSPLWPFMETPCILGPQHRPGRHTVPRTTQTPSGRSSHLSCGAESGKIKRSQQQACALPGGLFPKFPGDAPTPLRLAWGSNPQRARPIQAGRLQRSAWPRRPEKHHCEGVSSGWYLRTWPLV